MSLYLILVGETCIEKEAWDYKHLIKTLDTDMLKSQTEQKKRSWQDNPKNEHPQLPHYSFQHQQLENGHFLFIQRGNNFYKAGKT